MASAGIAYTDSVERPEQASWRRGKRGAGRGGNAIGWNRVWVANDGRSF
jgi:hypothetical protein